MRHTLLKDIFLFCILSVVTFFAVVFAYPSADSNLHLEILVSTAFICAVMFAANHWPAVAGILWLEIAIWVAMLFFLGGAVGIYITKELGEIDHTAGLLEFAMIVFAIMNVLISSIWVLRCLPRSRYSHFYVYSILLFSLIWGSVYIYGVIAINVLESHQVTRIAAAAFTSALLAYVVGWLLETAIADILDYTVDLRSGLRYIFLLIGAGTGLLFTDVLAIVLGFSIGGAVGFIVGIRIGHRFETLGFFLGLLAGGIVGFVVMFLIQAVGVIFLAPTISLLFASIHAKEVISIGAIRERIYISCLSSLMGLYPMYYLYYNNILSSSPLLFFILIALGIAFMGNGQLHLLSTIRLVLLERQLVRKFQAPHISRILYDILMNIVVVSCIYGVNYEFVEQVNSERILLFFVSIVVAIPSFLFSEKIFLYFFNASQLEKEDWKKGHKDFLCRKHSLRAIPTRNAIIYKLYKCPISDCSREHLLTGVEQLIGIIGTTNISDDPQDDKMFVSLWDRKPMTTTYAEIDALEIHLNKTFTGEDYNQAIQSVVGKIRNGMVEEKRKNIPVRVEEQVELSEASRRLLQDTFAWSG
ncbi:MAG: hypothetical protein AAF518_28620 [Spirochaetota bacterium]